MRARGYQNLVALERRVGHRAVVSVSIATKLGARLSPSSDELRPITTCPRTAAAACPKAQAFTSCAKRVTRPFVHVKIDRHGRPA